MATNDFLPFAGGVGSNVLTQAAYSALAARTAGFSSGLAKSAELNKVWRQSSIMSAVLGQFIANRSGGDAVDDGTTAVLLAGLELGLGAFMRQGSSADFANATGTANAIAASYLPAVTSLADGMMLRFRAIASPNTGAVTFAPNGMTAAAVYGVDGNPLSGGEIAAGAICTVVYSSTTNRWTLVSSSQGEIQVPAATKASHSVNLGQLLSTVSPLQLATAAATLANHAVNLGQFAFVAAVNGYVKIPTSASPIIIQWGQAASANLATSSAVFPIAFPTACLNVIAGGANANANTQAYAVVNNTSKTGFSWNAFIANGGSAPALAAAGTVNAWYIAVGT